MSGTSGKSGNGSKPDECRGGNSMNCNHRTHRKQQDVFCWRCKQRMGCTGCCEIERDRVCLNCRDWANRAALDTHGPLIKDKGKCAEGFRIVSMIALRSIDPADGEQLLSELFGS